MAGKDQSRITIGEFDAITRTALPMAGSMGLRVEKMTAGAVTARLPHDAQHLRPGGTIAGPAMMALADYAMYAVVLSMVGPARAEAVTVNLNINFLSRPEPRDLLAEGRIVKLGRRLAFGEVSLYSEGKADPVAHVTASYSIPPEK